MEPFVLVMARGVRSRAAASCRLHSAKAALSLVSLLCFFFSFLSIVSTKTLECLRACE